ncbi:MAG TPA: hypothetical protein VFZ91_01280 [Allosphingosinicella sp.]
MVQAGDAARGVDEGHGLIQHEAMAGQRREFQNRARRGRSDGEDFEDFVFECFRVAREEAGFARRLARGRDGAIDLIDRFAEAGAATVAECKYIGSGSADEALARWRDVAGHLKSHLPALHADPAKRPASPYRAWLDPERPVTRYRFCVTATLSDAQLAALERRIQADFAALVEAGVEPLRALADNRDGNVRVLRWDWFESELRLNPSLAFRWFRGLPAGVELFEEEEGSEATFRDFLKGRELRYLSRADYQEEGGKVERGEAELVASLAGDQRALLISGPGGVGKTRLSWELAAKLKSKRGFEVYRLGRSANYSSVIELAESYPSDAAILLLLDYAEASSGVAGIADAIEHVSAHSGHRLRLIATCRASAANPVRGALDVLVPEDKSLGSSRAGEEDYVRWVARSILELEPLPERSEIEHVCHGVPALAAFAIFLYRRHREAFDAQFRALHGVDDFGKWAARRIAALVARPPGDRRAAERTLARIALGLPMTVERFEAIERESAESRALLIALRDDRWIEREGDCYAPAHDVLADALAARWLLEADNAATARAADLLGEAARHGELGRALIALERLAPDGRFREIDGGAVVQELVQRYPEQALASRTILLGGALLRLEQKLELLRRSEVLTADVRSHPALDVSLSHLAAEAAHRKLDAQTCPGLATLIDLLGYALDRNQYSNMILRRAYALDPPRFRDVAHANVREFPRAESTHFLLVQMLRSGEPPETLLQPVQTWLEHQGTSWRASFLYAAWLDEGGAIEVVAAAVQGWLKVHARTPEASHVFRAWLDAGGDPEAVAWAVAAWLEVHALSEAASYVYDRWLRAGGGVATVARPIRAWIDLYGPSLGASHVYAAWLRAGAGNEAVAPEVQDWIGRHGLMEEASHVYNAWLRSDGDVEAVAAAVRAWIDRHGLTPEAQFVLNAWLDAGGAIEAVAADVEVWIEAHGDTPEAVHVYRAWLEAGGPPEKVAAAVAGWIDRHGLMPEASLAYSAWLNAGAAAEWVAPAMFEWIEKHARTIEASHVFQAWLDAGGDYEAILGPLELWVSTWKTSRRFSYLGKTLSRRHDLTENIAGAVIEWCRAFPDDDDAVSRLGYVCGHFHGDCVPFRLLEQLLFTIEEIIAQRRQAGSLTPTDQGIFWRLLVILFSQKFHNVNPDQVRRTMAAMIASGLVFGGDAAHSAVPVLKSTGEHAAHAVRLGLRHGLLEVERDGEALARFAAWLRSTEEGAERADAILARLDAEYPSRAWRDG